jgi:hypothetical protein
VPYIVVRKFFPLRLFVASDGEPDK